MKNKIHKKIGALGLGALVLSALSATAQDSIPQDLIPDEIVVSATGVPTPVAQIGASVDVITAEDLRDGQYVHLQDVLRGQGINIAQSGGTGTLSNVFLRGLPGRHTNLIVDGISLFDPRSNQVLWNDVLVDGTRQIEIIRGSHGVLYGSNAVAGVVSQFTAIGGETKAGAYAETGAYSTNRIGFTGQGELGQAAYGFAVSHFDTDGYSAADEDDGNTEDDGYDNTTFHARADLTLAPDTRVEFVVRHVSGEVEFDGGFSPADVVGKGEEYERFAYRVGLAHETGSWTHHFDVTGYDSEIDSITDFAVSASSDAKRQKLAYRGTGMVSDKLQLVIGIEDETSEFTDTNDYEVDVSAAYALVQATPSDALTVTAALRHDDHETFGTETTYRLTAAYAPDGPAIYRAAYGTAYRAPSLTELYLPVYGNADLQPETSESTELGADIFLSEAAKASITFFEITIDDIIGYEPFPSFKSVQVIGETRSRGAELGLSVSTTDTLGLRFSAAYTNSQKPDTAGSGDREREVRVPRVQAGVSANWRPRADLSLGASIRHIHDTVDVSNVVLDDYTLVGLTGRWQWRENTDLVARIENATDDDYQTVNGYGTSGRAAYIGIKQSF
ncbi:MAG: TonB-dependent receptor plug domain-containing protein [Parvibaculales bacterium]